MHFRARPGRAVFLNRMLDGEHLRTVSCAPCAPFPLGERPAHAPLGPGNGAWARQQRVNKAVSRFARRRAPVEPYRAAYRADLAAGLGVLGWALGLAGLGAAAAWGLLAPVGGR
jgi:hypothetical protein